MNAYRTIAAATKHTVPPHNSLDLHQEWTVHLAPFLIQSSQGLDGLVGRHIFRILIMGPVKETALCAEAAMSTVGEIALHLALFLREHLCNLLRIDRFHFLIHLRFLSFGIRAYQTRLPRAKLYSLPMKKR